MLKTEAIAHFLSTSSNVHLTKLYNYSMECQVNVAQDGGVRVNDIYMGRHWVGWKGKDGTIWKSFRIPLNADTLPQYTDRPLSFSLEEHVDGIGLTGWNWEKRESHWVGFDFDSIANHKAGLDKETLDRVLNLILQLPYTTVVKSTSGKGYHVYIHFSRPVFTENHTHHAALARSILSYLTMETGYDFKADVDVCGGVLWVYHRKQEGTDGLSLLREGEPFDVTKIPPNWLDHVEVTSKKAKKVKIRQDVSGLSTSQMGLGLDVEHNRLLKWFTQKAERDFWWDGDHSMLVCHTLDLAIAHKELALKGIFHTESSGSSAQNCFAFPISGGSWAVRRHGKNVREHPYWTTDNSGWTRCVFNGIADVESASKTNFGIKNIKNEYVFSSHSSGLLAVKHMGIDLGPSIEWLTGSAGNGVERALKLRVKGESLIISIKKLYDEEPQPKYFLGNKDFWEIIVDLPKIKRELNAPDDLVRHAISNGVEAGWYIKTGPDWVLQSRANVYTVLTAQDEYEKGEVELLAGKCILNPWRLVNRPFLEEYPGQREWNKDAASFKVTPASGSCDTWLKVINHCGKNLNDAVAQDAWCLDNGIKNGGEYLLCWFSSLLQSPEQPLPYLCFHGEQNTGKSTLHEALDAFILKHGYTRADYALTNPSGFNAEIANAVLCVVEETDLRVNKEAANRIKDWVTGKTISIRALYKNAYDINNTTHWIQCTNDLNYCIILPGDTRIVAIKVDKPTEDIPKQRLFDMLESEAAAFLFLLLNIEVPKATSRLAIPVLTTFEKKEIEGSHRTPLEQFMLEKCYVSNGSLIEYDKFYMAFVEWLAPADRGAWSSFKVSRSFPRVGTVCKGKWGAQNVTMVGNLTMNPDEIAERKLIIMDTHNGRLKEVE